MKTGLIGLALLLACQATTAQEVDPSLLEAVKNIKIDDLVTIPIKNLKVIESEGQIHYMSENGRYVLVGQMVDVLQRKPLDTMGQIKDSVSQLSFDNLGIDIDTLNTVSIGQGPKRVIAFIDPLCSVCMQVIQDAKELSSEYTFKFVVVPALGAKSNELSMKLACALNSEDVLPALQAGKLGGIATKRDCDIANYQMTLLLTDLMGVNGVPFIVAPNGEIVRGRPNDLKAWLKEQLS